MSPSLIKDRFKGIADRRVRYRMRMRAKKRCIVCGEKASGWRCKECAEKQNTLSRMRRLSMKMDNGEIKLKPAITGDALRKAIDETPDKK